jgi:transposase
MRPKRFVLQAWVLHADETPVAMFDPGRGKTKRAYVWVYARGAFDPLDGVVYEFCLGRGARYSTEFLQRKDGRDAFPPWIGRLVRDEYSAYDRVVAAQTDRVAAG